MKGGWKQMSLWAASAAVWVAQSAPAHACAVCFGAPDAPLSKGMYWGIISLLGVIGSVLGGITMFFVHVGRKSGAANRRLSESLDHTASNNEGKVVQNG